MEHIDEVAAANERKWEREVQKGGGHTIPFLDLDVEELRRFVRGDAREDRLVGRLEPRRYVSIGPLSLFTDLEGKDVLCLSAGGGQQSAVFGLLGARVTVVDIAQGQLEADREAAAHHGYDVTTVHADMRDLSSLRPESMDLVYGMTPCWAPDIRAVYAQVARVLRVGGVYRTDVGKPGLHFVEWDGSGYRITKPYCESRGPYDDDGGVETRHYMDDIFNGLLDAGLSLVQVIDGARWRQLPDAPPGSYHRMGAWTGGGFEIIARRAAS